MKIGPIEFAQPFCQAGLAGYSDRAMRVVARRRGCGYAVTEALLDIIMLNGGEGLRKSIDINDEDHPVAGQIIGSEPAQMAKAALILHNAGYDVIDLNFACPVKKIKNKARGGHMLFDVDRATGIIKAVRDALPPAATTTVSMRRGFDDLPESEDRFFKVLETVWDYGYAAARVHARTVEQKYQGSSHWPFLTKLKQTYPTRTILGSGDVFTAQDAVRMLRETGVDCVWIARGAIGNPWIFRDAAKLLRSPSPLQSQISNLKSCPGPSVGAGSPRPLSSDEMQKGGETPPLHDFRELPRTGARSGDALLTPPSIPEQRDALSEHFALAMEIHGEQLAGRRMRKMGIKYARFHPQAQQVKSEFIAVKSLREWSNVLTKWYADGGQGVWPDPKAADEVNEAAACETT